MKFKADEIANVIREEIANYRTEVDVAQVGRVLEVGDGIAQIYGLAGAMAGEMIQFQNGTLGQVFNLEESSIGAVIYGPTDAVRSGDSVRSTGALLEVPTGPALLGRVVNPLGKALDGGQPINAPYHRPLEMMAPGIAGRQPVSEPMLTGIKAIDAMTPVGRGQRELIIGDRKTGKTAIALDAIINQKDSGVICVYVAIGQKESTVASTVQMLAQKGAMEHTIVVAASSSDPAPLQYIAPYSGCAMAEYFMYELGKPTLVVYDDLTKQAAAYRQISLLLRRPPGREAYPGDVFYLHSRLLERACRLAQRYVVAPANSGPEQLTAAASEGQVFEGPLGLEKAKHQIQQGGRGDLAVQTVPGSGGSMTALPICETQEGEVSAYIPTNLISITDGQIYLEPGLFFSGVRPAVNVGISVSRVGYKAAFPGMKDVAKSLRLDLAAYRELESFSQMGMELDAASQRQVDRGMRMVRLLIQPQYQPMNATDQIISIYAGLRGFLDDLTVDEVRNFEAQLLKHVKTAHVDFYQELDRDRKFTRELDRQLKTIITSFKETAWRDFRRARRGSGAASG